MPPLSFLPPPSPPLRLPGLLAHRSDHPSASPSRTYRNNHRCGGHRELESPSRPYTFSNCERPWERIWRNMSRRIHQGGGGKEPIQAEISAVIYQNGGFQGGASRKKIRKRDKIPVYQRLSALPTISDIHRESADTCGWEQSRFSLGFSFFHRGEAPRQTLQLRRLPKAPSAYDS
ncbi:uncharacterized protein LACBIDRAFT_296050 [Laccaria bicolor S238N-H82]|uniref:Predicted protein n=1 Tax=Laccaria bicolor (strain S238N-H82 / ATCC MYA-4686) TaxID=486041 RepID=B0E2Q7_LACBS|nr:uncharacterized protein LACBIDRAFT_296050 [Laccaria bicolor S238N-H82]EDQ98873.1 predicted protein [Laccaria bicolor S238N-H82]|eukprot:XP_001890483.1 predicted protein [Laccaria bicolor S238N-H82]